MPRDYPLLSDESHEELEKLFARTADIAGHLRQFGRINTPAEDLADAILMVQTLCKVLMEAKEPQ